MSIEVKSRVAQNALNMAKEPIKVTFLVGNGFDIGIGLKTAYKDFIEYYTTKHIPPNAIVDKLVSKIQKDIETWGDVEYAFGQLPFSEFGVDAESAYRICLSDFQRTLEEYLCNESARLVLPEGKAENTRAFLLRSIVETITKVNTNILEGRDRVVIDILNFNYTDTVDRLLCADGKDYPEIETSVADKSILIQVGKIYHPHGKLGAKILFGVDNPNQVADATMRQLSKSEGYLIKSARAELGKYAFYNDALRAISRCDIAFLFGLSYGITDLSWWDGLTGYRDMDRHGIARLVPKIVLTTYTKAPIDEYTIDDGAYIAHRERERFFHALTSELHSPRYAGRHRSKLYVVGHGPFWDPMSNGSYYCDPLHLHAIGKMFVNGYDGQPIVNARV